MNESRKSKFVLNILSNKKEGFYVELGGFHSELDSHTYLLEKDYNWNGVAIEIDKERQIEYSNNRKNDCVLADALTFDYLNYFEKNNYPKQIDFLSINIDPGYTLNGKMNGNPAQSLLGLIALPLNKYRFTVITFEHDSLQDYKNDSIKMAQREILSSLGYSLVVREWCEDWWVDSNVISYPEYKNFYRIDL